MSFLLFLFGAAIALIIPDIDQRLPFLVHRSLLTHGMLLPLLAYWLARGSDTCRGLPPPHSAAAFPNQRARRLRYRPRFFPKRTV
jgi:hypothetical protein